MEYQFKATGIVSQSNQLNGIYLFAWLSMIVTNFFQKMPMLFGVFHIFCLFLLFGSYYFLCRRIVMTVSTEGVFYKNQNFIFSPRLKDISSEQIKHILIPNFSTSFFDNLNSPIEKHIGFLDHNKKLLLLLKPKSWHPLSNISLEQAVLSSFEGVSELANSDSMQLIRDLRLKSMQASQDLGKTAGYFSYVALGFSIICIILLFLDANITIAWGNYPYLIWSVVILGVIYCAAIISRSTKNTGAILLIAILFSGTSSLLIHQTFMLLNYHFGTKKTYIFEKVIQNKENEVWKTKTGEEINCIASPRALRAQKSATVRKGIFGIVRTQFKEICLNPEQIKKLSGKKL